MKIHTLVVVTYHSADSKRMEVAVRLYCRWLAVGRIQTMDKRDCLHFWNFKFVQKEMFIEGVVLTVACSVFWEMSL